MKDRYDLPCNIAQTLNIIGDRWTLLIIHELLGDHHTFNQLKSTLEGISSRLLSERLKHLEQSGLVASRLYSEHPPRYKYEATESGKALESVFRALVVWGRDHLPKCYKKLVHASCGHEVELTCYCPHCQTNTSDLAVVPMEATASAVNALPT